MKVYAKEAQKGFTIVELLIVIVVIGILAAITIVAYTGIQNQANDRAVQSDLRNFAGKVMEYQATASHYPHGAGVNGPGGLTFRVSRSAYATNMHNFIYCTNRSEGADKFILVGTSKSGTRFAYSNDKGAHTYTQTWGGVANVCSNEGYADTNFSYGYLNSGSASTWHPWTQ